MATKLKSAKIFDMDSYKGGGSILNPGLYRIAKARIAMFDFMGKSAERASGALTLQPVDKNYKDVGESSVHFFPVGLYIPDSTTEEFLERQGDAKPSKDGRQLMIPEDAELSKKCDLYMLLASIAEHGFDMDAADEDFGTLDGWVMEFDVKDDVNYKASAVKDDDDEGGSKKKGKRTGPRQVIYVKSIPKQKGGAAKKDEEGEEGEKPAKKGKPTEEAEAPTDPAGLVKSFLAEKVCTDKNESGIDRTLARTGLKKFILAAGADADLEPACAKLFANGEKLGKLLPKGWSVNDDDEIVKE